MTPKIMEKIVALASAFIDPTVSVTLRNRVRWFGVCMKLKRKGHDLLNKVCLISESKRITNLPYPGLPSNAIVVKYVQPHFAPCTSLRLL